MLTILHVCGATPAVHIKAMASLSLPLFDYCNIIMFMIASDMMKIK